MGEHRAETGTEGKASPWGNEPRTQSDELGAPVILAPKWGPVWGKGKDTGPTGKEILQLHIPLIGKHQC